MFTIILTFVGCLVFFITLFTKTFKVAFKRLLMFAGTGVVLDIMFMLFASAALYVIHN